MVNEPEAGTTFLIVAVASFVLMVAKILLAVVTSEFVTVKDVAPAAKFTVPTGRSMVRAPVTPAAVLVEINRTFPALPMRNFSVATLMPATSVPEEVYMATPSPSKNWDLSKMPAMNAISPIYPDGGKITRPPSVSFPEFVVPLTANFPDVRIEKSDNGE